MEHKKIAKLESYKKIISGTEFMEKFLQDPNIFSPNSPKFKIFLIQSFSYFHPDFHYMSFLNNEDADLEIIKAARILQILPVDSTNKLFDNMSEGEIFKFWEKFFSLFKNKKMHDSKTDSIFTYSWEQKINFFKDMKNTLNYLNYEFVVVNMIKLSNSDIDKQLNSWKELAIEADISQDKSTSLNCIENEMISVDLQKFIVNLKQMVSMYVNKKFINKINNPEYLDFFVNLIYLTKNIIQYKKKLSIIISSAFHDFNCEMLFADINYLSEKVHFMKRCNNFANALKSKLDTFH